MPVGFIIWDVMNVSSGMTLNERFFNVSMRP
jgi:hypothetical protein